MIEWWNSLGLAVQVFYCIAVPATLILIIQTVLMFLGMDDDADGAGDVGVEDMSGDAVADDLPDVDEGVFGENSVSEAHDGAGFEGLRIFTIRGIVAFFVVFGWVGVVMGGLDIKMYITIPVATLCGFAMMFLLALLFKAVMRLRSDGNTDNRNAIGTAGKVYLTIPPDRNGEGKVYVMLQGAYVEREAVTDDSEAIPTGSEIIVVGVSGQTSLVVKRK